MPLVTSFIVNEFLTAAWPLITKTVAAFWDVLAEMSPWLLFGFLVAGILSVVIPTSMVKRHLAGKGFWSVAKASLFGIPLPLCSCGVIPVGVSLRKSGASRGAALSFLISTPQTGVDSIAVTYSLLGPVLAVYRPVVAFVTGVVGGILGNLLKYNDTDLEAAEDVTSGDESCAPEPADDT